MSDSPGKLRINIGCGATPTPGWLNFDNSLTVRLAKCPGLMEALHAAGAVTSGQVHSAAVVRAHGIRWANAVRRIPVPDASAEVVYSSHMLEDLDPEHEVTRFLAEVRRVLAPNGILRLAVPDLWRRAHRYIMESRDADEFVRSLHMTRGTPRGLCALARYLLVGFRNDRWAYDAASLIRLLEAHRFCDARELLPGETTIPDPGPLNLREREEESIYVEARRA